MRKNAARGDGRKKTFVHRLLPSNTFHAARHRSSGGRAGYTTSLRFRKARLIVLLLLVISVIGYLLLALPPAMGMSRQILEAQQAEGYRTLVGGGSTQPTNSLEQGLVKLRSSVRTFNKNRRATSPKDPFTPFGILSTKNYSDLVAQMPGGVVGTLTIPSIGVDRQIKAGIDLSQIEGIVHLPQTALPADMDGINAVIAGHNGDIEDPSFDHLDRMKVGQKFTVTTLGQELVYRVDSIRTVRPNNLSGVRGVKGRSYVTLMTCTPRYINEFRLLVRGRLVAVHSMDNDPADPANMPAWMPVAVCLLILAVFAEGVVLCEEVLLVAPKDEAVIVGAHAGHAGRNAASFKPAHALSRQKRFF